MDDDDDLLDWVEKTKRDIETAPICEPGPDEYIGPCHWIRTGWGI